MVIVYIFRIDDDRIVGSLCGSTVFQGPGSVKYYDHDPIYIRIVQNVSMRVQHDASNLISLCTIFDPRSVEASGLRRSLT